jgi:hypothetical protein
MEIKFNGCLSEHTNSPLSFYREGGAKLVLDIDPSEIAEIVKIMPFCYNRLLEITLKVKDIDDIKAEIRSEKKE